VVFVDGLSASEKMTGYFTEAKNLGREGDYATGPLPEECGARQMEGPRC